MITKNNYFLAIVFLMLFFISCSSQGQQIDSNEFNTPDIEQNTGLIFNFSGYVVYKEELNMSFSEPGQIAELFVEEGDFLAAGDIIARLDLPEIQSEIERSKASLEIAQANLEKVMVGPHPSQITEAEYILEEVIAIRPLTYEQSVARAFKIAAADAFLEFLNSQPLPEDIAIAEAQVQLEQIKYEHSLRRLAQAEIIAPIDGFISEIFNREFEHVFTGEPIVRLSNITDLRVIIPINSFDLSKIIIGQSVNIIFEVLPGVEVKGTVVSMVINPNERASDFLVIIDINQNHEEIRWGMVANVLFLP